MLGFILVHIFNSLFAQLHINTTEIDRGGPKRLPQEICAEVPNERI